VGELRMDCGCRVSVLLLFLCSAKLIITVELMQKNYQALLSLYSFTQRIATSFKMALTASSKMTLTQLRLAFACEFNRTIHEKDRLYIGRWKGRAC